MEDYNKIIESIQVKLVNAANYEVIKPFTINNFHVIENTIMLVNTGQIVFGESKMTVGPDEILFVPANKSVMLSYSSPQTSEAISHHTFVEEKASYLKHLDLEAHPANDNFFYVTFDAKVFDSLNFFASLDIPPFIINGNDRIRQVLKNVIEESSDKTAGRNRMLRCYMEMMLIEIIRHLIDKQLFVEQLATNSAYFKDPRLIDVFNYIKQNLDADLSNRVLAYIANLSEDYVGQYFKMMAGINPQDYIEYQRMEKAVELLRTTKYSIKEIGRRVGFRDTAYFCRRFKMMFGLTARQMRKREARIDG